MSNAIIVIMTVVKLNLVVLNQVSRIHTPQVVYSLPIYSATLYVPKFYFHTMVETRAKRTNQAIANARTRKGKANAARPAGHKAGSKAKAEATTARPVAQAKKIRKVMDYVAMPPYDKTPRKSKALPAATKGTICFCLQFPTHIT